MHKLRGHENEHAPCNALCLPGEGLHADLIFIAPQITAGLTVPLLVYVKDAWQRLGRSRESEIVGIKAAGEAADVSQYYPVSYRAKPASTEPYLVRYRVRKGEEA
jgi:hypothetical protein